MAAQIGRFISVALVRVLSDRGSCARDRRPRLSSATHSRKKPAFRPRRRRRTPSCQFAYVHLQGTPPPACPQRAVTTGSPRMAVRPNEGGRVEPQ
jgi:hypothetical protein